MPFLALLKSPRIIGMLIGGLAILGGFALLALALSWHSRGQRIETLEARLAHCHDQRATIVAENESLADSIERQNKATATRIETINRALEAERKRAEKAKRIARQHEEALQARLSSVDRTHIPETLKERVEQCDRALDHLTR